MKDYYATLGVTSSAEEIVIRAAWKALSQRYHPDRFAGDAAQANARMSEINEAYSVLSNPVQRTAYDQSWAERNCATEMGEGNTGQAANGGDLPEKDWASEAGIQAMFGSKPEIIVFARQLLFEGNKAALQALNDSIRELSSDVPAEWIINRICEDFNIETKAMWKRRLQREAKAREDAIWKQVREKAQMATAAASNTIVPDSMPPDLILPPQRPAEILPRHEQRSFMAAAVIVVLFVVIVIWLFL